MDFREKAAPFGHFSNVIRVVRVLSLLKCSQRVVKEPEVVVPARSESADRAAHKEIAQTDR